MDFIATNIMMALRRGPLLAYAETGKLILPDWRYEEVSSPEDYAAEIDGWIQNYGVQIVGGCCGTGPEHIRVLRQLLDKLGSQS